MVVDNPLLTCRHIFDNTGYNQIILVYKRIKTRTRTNLRGRRATNTGTGQVDRFPLRKHRSYGQNSGG